MAFDPNTLVSIPNTWLETRVRYEGLARAEFTDPPGAIEGPAKVRFDSGGACRVSIEVDRIDAPDPENFSLRSGSPRSGDYLVHGGANPCSSLIVRTDAGAFTADERIIHDGFRMDARPRVELRPIWSRFEVTGAGQAKHWVLPLANFMLDSWFGGVYEQLANHPLRLCPTPRIPVDLPEEDLAMANFHVYAQSNLLTFLLNGEVGFIERMPNYKRRVRRVRRRKTRRITAVMVGPAHVQTVKFSDYEGLFPLDILSALSLATGVPVGAPWIEFRDEKGALVRRVHICFGAARFEQGHAGLPDHVQNAIGYLVGQVLCAPDRGKKYLRVAINHALSAARRGSLEGRFISLCRGFETLCRHHGLVKQDLSARLEPAQQRALKTLLGEVAAKIRAMKKAEADPGRKAVLDTIASRAQNAGQTEKAFGLAVLDLVQKFGLHDAQVLDARLSAHPHPAGATWPGILSHYRGAATHDAYFDIIKPQDLYDIIRVMNHLHDVLLRIILKTVGYVGPYQSPISPVAMRRSLDWVTPTVPPMALGFA
jgi:hypothetical protein